MCFNFCQLSFLEYAISSHITNKEEIQDGIEIYHVTKYITFYSTTHWYDICNLFKSFDYLLVLKLRNAQTLIVLITAKR